MAAPWQLHVIPHDGPPATIHQYRCACARVVGVQGQLMWPTDIDVTRDTVRGVPVVTFRGAHTAHRDALAGCAHVWSGPEERMVESSALRVFKDALPAGKSLYTHEDCVFVAHASVEFVAGVVATLHDTPP